jgi:hypothetical protein
MIYDLNSVDIKTGFRSDHSLIDINFNNHLQSKRGPGYWRFNANLLRDVEYVNYMNTKIDEIKQKHMDIGDASLAWDVIKMELRSSTICYSKKKAKYNREHIKKIIIENDKLEKEISRNPTDEIITQYNATKMEIEYYNNEKANGILIRSKADWAEFGEKNTKFFLNLEKRNYKNKCITKLIDENEEIISNDDEILKYEETFYKNVYSTPEIERVEDTQEDINSFLDPNTPKIGEPEKELCEQELSLDEIGRALRDLTNGKSPGTDGFTPDFYKFFWAKLKMLVLNSLKAAYVNNELSIDQKRGVINLIPKKDKDMRFLKNWRPIALLNTDYKILTKTLATRLKQVLPQVINEDQVAYLKERFIGQNIRTNRHNRLHKRQKKPRNNCFLRFRKSIRYNKMGCNTKNIKNIWSRR